MIYKDYLKTEHWQNIRKRFYRRRKRKCLICGSTKSLNIHHKRYDLFNERGGDLKALCQECHYLWHKFQPKRVFKLKFASRIRNLIGWGVKKETAFKGCVGTFYRKKKKKIKTSKWKKLSTTIY